ncbi:hypothetical protein DFQ27_004122 [Actinomortierella ambigua]|uniref:Pyridoxamine 5'-phosphate oxidase N-terminal domain-containing protein n=1 Tax=Actinomortierella ambigua TaxID=1343610 RepID=A0A9P6Q4F1_9FUNG|nr:hypothetical protein DFQ27_004122 [Actinomortierella ambigua]
MGVYYDEIDDNIAAWIKKQKIFFVASAPLDPDGVVNTSPKGYDCFRIINPNKVCYLDLTGSGIETLSHIKENGRVTFMFTAFEGPPRILRLWSRGEVYEIDTPEFNELYEEHFRGSSELTNNKGIRSIVVGNVYKVATSCGYGVPFFDYKEPRTSLALYWNKKDLEKIHDYWLLKNNASLDGLVGMRHKDSVDRVPPPKAYFERKYDGKPYPPECAGKPTKATVTTTKKRDLLHAGGGGIGGVYDWVQAGALVATGFAAGIAATYLADKTFLFL